MISFKGRHFPKDMILMAVRWKVSYPLSYRNIEELMEERGAEVDHSTIQKWVVHYAPKLEDSFRKRKNPVGKSWKMDETYSRCREMIGVRLMDKNWRIFFDFKSLTKYHGLR